MIDGKLALDLDRWLTTPPDPDTKCFCRECDAELYEGELYFSIEGEILCENCANDWLENCKGYVTEEMVTGEV